MTAITAALVKELRDKTGAGMMDCKAALNETGGDIEAAVDWLRAKGLSKAAKKAGRTAAEGLVAIATAGAARRVRHRRGQRRDRFRRQERAVPGAGAQHRSRRAQGRRRCRDPEGRGLSGRRHGGRGHRQRHRHHRREHGPAPREEARGRAGASSPPTCTTRRARGWAASACWSRWSRRARPTNSPLSAACSPCTWRRRTPSRSTSRASTPRCWRARRRSWREERRQAAPCP